MRKQIATLLTACLLATASQAAVSVTLSMGVLYGADTLTPLADGALVQLVSAGVDGLFVAPDDASFIKGDDRLVASISFDSSLAGMGPGISVRQVSFDMAALGVAAGQKLELRWFPNLTLASATPGVTIYGTYTTQSTIDFSSSGWVLPSDGAFIDLNLITLGVGGSNLEDAGVASQVTVPEPSTYAALLGLVSLGVVAFRRFRR